MPWVLGTKLGSSVRAVPTLSHLSSPPRNLLKTVRIAPVIENHYPGVVAGIIFDEFEASLVYTASIPGRSGVNQS